ncbi:MAG TPA: hypothetical protein PKA41_12955 [Verrucomicrobiota bacterium]|nr:hypothetical protein [Verrucomicrobiota bacterium]
MKKKEIFLIVLTLLLGCGYAWFFTDWFKPKSISIQHTIRPYREAWGGGRRATNTTARVSQVISFVMNRDWKLTEVKVVSAAEFQTNKYAHPTWHLVSDKQSRSVRSFVYGGRIPGMRPSVAGAEPDALLPGVTYKLIVRSGTIQGEDEFVVEASKTR